MAHLVIRSPPSPSQGPNQGNDSVTQSPSNPNPKSRASSRSKSSTKASSSDKSNSKPVGSKDEDPNSLGYKIRNRDLSSIVRDLWDAFDAWRATRQWKRMLWFLPSFLLLITFVGIVYMGKSMSRDELLKRYLELAEAESPPKNPGDELDSPETLSQQEQEEQAKSSEYTELLFRRILQLESNNKQARYYVASRMAQGSNPVQGRAMMLELAPPDASKPGYLPAHAWMAVDLFKRTLRKEPVDLVAIGHHLKMASQWDRVTPSLLVLYSRYLEEKERNYSTAISVMQKAANAEPKLQLALAELCVRGKNMTLAKEVANDLIRRLNEKLEKKQGTEEDRIAIAQSYLILGDTESAMQVLRNGLASDSNQARVRRALSDILRMKFRSTMRQTETGIEADLALLNSALMVDPANPKVGEEIAQLINADASYIRNDEILDRLRTQLADGNATAITHLLLANAYQVRGLSNKAISHWELCLAQNPNQVLALNNLSVALTRTETPQIERSIELIERALKIAGNDPELLDSHGTILLAANRPHEAIAAMEKAIAVDPERISTREKLVAAYEKVELPDLAAKQRERIEAIKIELDRRAVIAAEQARIRKELEETEAKAKADAEAQAQAQAQSEEEEEGTP